MTKHFVNFSQLAGHLDAVATSMERKMAGPWMNAARSIQIMAKYTIGRGPAPGFGFEPWEDLADSTKEEKERLGYVGKVSQYDPLLRTGELRRSIEYRVVHHGHGEMVAYIGSDLDIAVYQELGTSRMPPRPFLAPAAVMAAPQIAHYLGAVVVNLVCGADVFPVATMESGLFSTNGDGE
jgi:hypothetical protein